MVDATLMDLTAVCHGFPEVSDQVERENILDAIDTVFEGNTSTVIVEGEEGIGKTSLLAQFEDCIARR